MSLSSTEGLDCPPEPTAGQESPKPQGYDESENEQTRTPPTVQKNDDGEAEDGKKSKQTKAGRQKSPASQPRQEVMVNGHTTPSRSPPASGACESPESCSTERSSEQRRQERAMTMEERKKKLHAEALDKKLQGVSWSKKQEEEEAEKKRKEEEAEKRREQALRKSKELTNEMAKKRTSQGDWSTRLSQDASTRSERLKKMELEAREKELASLSKSSPGTKNVTEVVERLAQGSSQKDREKRLKLKEEAEKKLRESTEVKVFTSEESQKILEKGCKGGSTLAERNEAMLERKRKALEEKQAKEEEELRKGREALKRKINSSVQRGLMHASSETSPSTTSSSFLDGPRPSTAPARREAGASSNLRKSAQLQSSTPRTPSERKARTPRDRVIKYSADDDGSALDGRAGAVTVARAQKKNSSEVPVVLASDDKIQELLEEQLQTIAARDATIVAQAAMLEERDDTIIELNALIAQLTNRNEDLQRTIEQMDKLPAEVAGLAENLCTQLEGLREDGQATVGDEQTSEA